MKELLREVYHRLLLQFGRQGWWPAEGEFEMIIGAVLTQNTAWRNVEMALQNFRKPITPDTVLAMSQTELEDAVRPCGYYRQKAAHLLKIATWCKEFGFRAEDFACVDTGQLRKMLLSLCGVGPETADSILLYALERPVFVVDAYTRRVLSRLCGDACYLTMPYDAVAALFYENVLPELAVYNEYHALLVRFCKEYCTKRKPACACCPLADRCASVDTDAQM